MSTAILHNTFNTTTPLINATLARDAWNVEWASTTIALNYGMELSEQL